MTPELDIPWCTSSRNNLPLLSLPCYLHQGELESIVAWFLITTSPNAEKEEEAEEMMTLTRRKRPPPPNQLETKAPTNNNNSSGFKLQCLMVRSRRKIALCRCSKHHTGTFAVWIEIIFSAVEEEWGEEARQRYRWQREAKITVPGGGGNDDKKTTTNQS